MTFPDPTITSGGYFCNNCKTWIPNGVYHYCTPVTQTYPMYYMYPCPPFDYSRLERIERLLDEILELLKKKSGEITDPHI